MHGESTTFSIATRKLDTGTQHKTYKILILIVHEAQIIFSEHAFLPFL